MRRFIILIISSCAMLFASAQEEIFSDSIAKKHPEIQMNPSNVDQILMFDENSFSHEINSLDYSIFKEPLLPEYNKNLDFLKSLHSSKVTDLSYSFSRTTFNPIFPFGQIFNQSAYRINDRFIVGGNSFGAQSIYDLPKINTSIQDMSIKGASMFMQYKVNDHFKVETRVSISNRQSLPWEP